MAISGGCLCGAVRIRSAEEPVAVRSCWCRVCQYLAAGSASVNAIFRRAAVSVEGPLSRFDSVADSGNHMTRSFCATCGTPVLSESRERPDVVIVRVGALDDPGRFRPTGTIWTDSAPAWGLVDPATEQVPRQPAPPRPEPRP